MRGSIDAPGDPSAGSAASAGVAGSAQLAELAQRVRSFADRTRGEIYLVGELAGPETWKGRVADVFWEELFDRARSLGRMGDELELVARRLELRANDLDMLTRPPSTGEGAIPG